MAVLVLLGVMVGMVVIQRLALFKPLADSVVVEVQQVRLEVIPPTALLEYF
jgi:hypothetical protein